MYIDQIRSFDDYKVYANMVDPVFGSENVYSAISHSDFVAERPIMSLGTIKGKEHLNFSPSGSVETLAAIRFKNLTFQVRILHILERGRYAFFMLLRGRYGKLLRTTGIIDITQAFNSVRDLIVLHNQNHSNNNDVMQNENSSTCHECITIHNGIMDNEDT